MNREIKLYKGWVESLSQAGIHPISDDTVAKILAIVYVYGGSMDRHSLCPKTSKIKWDGSA